MSNDSGFERGLLDFELSRRLLLGLGGALGVATAPGTAEAHGGPGGRNRMLIKNGTVLTLDSTLGDFAKGDVLVENGKIAAVAATISAHDAEVVDARGMIVMSLPAGRSSGAASSSAWT